MSSNNDDNSGPPLIPANAQQDRNPEMGREVGDGDGRGERGGGDGSVHPKGPDSIEDGNASRKSVRRDDGHSQGILKTEYQQDLQDEEADGTQTQVVETSAAALQVRGVQTHLKQQQQQF